VDVHSPGISPRDDRLLSIGWVPIDGGTITLAGAGHVVLRLSRRDGIDIRAAAAAIADDPAVMAGLFEEK